MPLNFPDDWGVRKDWTSIESIDVDKVPDVSKLIVYANPSAQSVPYIKRQNVPSLGLGDLVKHKPIRCADKTTTQSRLGDSGYEDMIEYWVLNNDTFQPDGADREQHKKLMQTLARRGITCR